MYAYVRNNPTTLTDPSGLESASTSQSPSGCVENYGNGPCGQPPTQATQTGANTEDRDQKESGVDVPSAPTDTAPPPAAPPVPAPSPEPPAPPDIVPPPLVPVLSAAALVVVAAEQLITRTTDAFVANQNDQIKYDATMSVVTVENASKEHTKGARKSTWKNTRTSVREGVPPRTGKNRALNRVRRPVLRRWNRAIIDAKYLREELKTVTQLSRRETVKAVSDKTASRIGRELFYGIRRNQNRRRAFVYLLQAAKAGYVHSQNLVGYCYSLGIGTKKDPRSALYWFRHAAEGNHTEAPYNLALAYEKGEGTAVDLKRAFKYYKQAAMLGNPAAQCNLGVAYLEGLGTKQDVQKAMNWLRKAARRGDARAEYNLGTAYLEGHRDPNKLTTCGYVARPVRRGGEMNRRAERCGIFSKVAETFEQRRAGADSCLWESAIPKGLLSRPHANWGYTLPRHALLSPRLHSRRTAIHHHQHLSPHAPFPFRPLSALLCPEGLRTLGPQVRATKSRSATGITFSLSRLGSDAAP